MALASHLVCIFYNLCCLLYTQASLLQTVIEEKLDR